VTMLANRIAGFAGKVLDDELVSIGRGRHPDMLLGCGHEI
jgi:hypothetical protein